jgi:hypothetical protein
MWANAGSTDWPIWASLRDKSKGSGQLNAALSNLYRQPLLIS